MFLLDTNVVSELRRIADGRGNPQVTQWAAAGDPGDMFLSAITLFELERGVRLLERRDPVQALALRDWLTHAIVPRHQGRILPVDAHVALLAATFHVPDPAPYADSLIAATALVHGLTLATRNAADFRRFGVRLVNPWER